MVIFSNFLGHSLDVFMDDFFIFGNDFDNFLAHLTKILKVCVKKWLVLTCKKSHFMVQEGVALMRLVLSNGLNDVRYLKYDDMMMMNLFKKYSYK